MTLPSPAAAKLDARHATCIVVTVMMSSRWSLWAALQNYLIVIRDCGQTWKTSPFPTVSTPVAAGTLSPPALVLFFPCIYCLIFLPCLPRADCTCSSSLTTIQPVECACSSWSSLNASQFHGFMVSCTHLSVIVLKLFPFLLSLTFFWSWRSNI